MEPAEILHQLIHSQDLPREALRAATEQRAVMAPLLIERIESCINGDTIDGLPFFGFHLLGQWGETSAYCTLARLLRCPADRLDRALGWSITETAHRVMAAVFDGDPAPIYNIILDAEAEEFVRSRMCETLAMLVLQERLDRTEVAAFLRDCWVGLQSQEDCFVWHGWQSAIAMLGLVDLKETVEEAFKRGLVQSEWLEYEDFEADLALALLGSAEPASPPKREYAPFGDAIEELSKWHGFSEEYARERERVRNMPTLPLLSSLMSVTNPLRGIGRNDPCPCGSGRKYKKCCLDSAAVANTSAISAFAKA
jgi:hypothetical protein